MNKKLLFSAAVMLAGVAMAAITTSPGAWTRSRGDARIDRPAAPATVKLVAVPGVSLLAAAGTDDAETTIISGYPRTSSENVTIIDANGDANGTHNTWFIESTSDGYRLTYEGYKYGTPTPADFGDDWAILPIMVEEPSHLRVTFDTKSQNTQDHTFDVWCGNSAKAEAMTTKLGEYNHNGGSSAPQTLEVNFDAYEAGTYYVGFHATFAKGNGKLYISNICAMRKKLSVISLEPGDEVFGMHPTQAEFDGCTLIDGNGDGEKIEYYYAESGDNVFDWPIYYQNNKATADADEWLITPAISLSKNDALYQLQIDARSGATGMPEAFEVCLGEAPSPEAMTIKAIDEPRIFNTDFSTFVGRFGIERPGKYYIGVHIKSPRSGSWRMMLRDLKLTYTGLSAAVPQPISDLRVTPEASGALYANVEFTMPTRTVNGQDLDTTRPLTAVITTDAGSVDVYAMPGSPVAKYVEAISGVNQVTVLVKNDQGEGAPVKATVRCGIDTPVAPVVSSRCSDNNKSLVMTWEPVSTGQHGGIVLSKDVKYNVYQYVESEDSEGNVMAGWNVIASDLTECTYTFSTRESMQQLYEFAVTSKNSAGESDGTVESSARGRLGNLYSLPFAENYTNGNVNYSGYVIEYPDDTYNASWGFVTAGNWTEAAGNVGSLACASTDNNFNMGRIALPKFNIKGKHDLVASLRVWLDDLTAPTDVLMELSTGEFVKLGHLGPDDVGAWTNFNFAVPNECGDAAWASLVLESTFRSPVYCLMICAVNVSQLDDYDLALSESVISNGVQGEEISAKVSISNIGSKTMTIPAVRGIVTQGSETVAEFDMIPESASLVSGASTFAVGTFRIDKADYVGKTLNVQITLSGSDDKNTNNSSATSFKLLANEAPVITDLTGLANDNGTGVVLSWTNPAESDNVESFEYIDHGVYGSKLAGWSNIDFDRKDCWTTEETPIPDAVTPKAFQVVSASTLGNGFTAHTGDRFLIAFSAQEALTDDWLISPEINPADGFSFWTRVIGSDYPENLEVLASTTDNDFDSFEVVLSLTLTNTGWRQTIVNLPAGTRYVALHYCSYDQFGLMIDDIQYTPANVAYDIKGFNVYSNGECVARSLTASTYEHISPTYSTNLYNVTVVASHNGAADQEYPMSNTFSLAYTGIGGVDAAGTQAVVAVDGGILLSGFTPSQVVNVYSATGARVAAATIASDGTARIALESGVYIVAATKVVVR